MFVDAPAGSKAPTFVSNCDVTGNVSTELESSVRVDVTPASSESPDRVSVTREVGLDSSLRGRKHGNPCRLLLAMQHITDVSITTPNKNAKKKDKIFLERIGKPETKTTTKTKPKRRSQNKHTLSAVVQASPMPNACRKIASCPHVKGVEAARLLMSTEVRIACAGPTISTLLRSNGMYT